MTEHPSLAAGSLNIDRVLSAERVELRLAGDLDLASKPELDAQLAELSRAAPSHIVIDLGGVAFMDSTALASILRAHGAAHVTGKTLTFRRGPAQVQRLLAVTHVDEHLIYEN